MLPKTWSKHKDSQCTSEGWLFTNKQITIHLTEQTLIHFCTVPSSPDTAFKN